MHKLWQKMQMFCQCCDGKKATFAKESGKVRAIELLMEPQ
jgi:hypothetical protein